MNLITIMYQLIEICYHMIMVYYLYIDTVDRRLYDHLHSQNIKKMLMSVHDPIIVKTNVCSFKYVTRNQLYVNSHIMITVI